MNLIPLCAANKGIGYEIARQMAAEGLRTIVTARNGMRSMPEHAAAATDVIRARHARHTPTCASNTGSLVVAYQFRHAPADSGLSYAAELGQEAADKIARSTGMHTALPPVPVHRPFTRASNEQHPFQAMPAGVGHACSSCAEGKACPAGADACGLSKHPFTRNCMG